MLGDQFQRRYRKNEESAPVCLRASEQDTLRGYSPVVVMVNFNCVDNLPVADLELTTWSLTMELGRDVKTQLCALAGANPAYHLPAVREDMVELTQRSRMAGPRDWRRQVGRCGCWQCRQRTRRGRRWQARRQSAPRQQ